MTISFLTGVFVAGEFDPGTVPAFAALCLLINSKQAFTLWMRSTGSDARVHLLVLAGEVAVAGTLLLTVLGGAPVAFLPYAAVPLVYLVLLRFAGEHNLLTEIAGFSLLSLSALIGKFAASGEIDPRLYLAVAIFFTAGVFRVRIQFRKKFFYRLLMVIYIAFAVVLYRAASLPVIALFPLTDNLLFAAILYRVKVRTTGWLEVAKGTLFLVLMVIYY
jgi:hypothetical protein